MTDAQLILASASPRRRELLTQIGIKHQVLPVDCDERVAKGESAEHYVARVARDKALACKQKAGARALPVLAADTAVVIGKDILGKPRDLAHAKEMLGALSGQTHRVLSAVFMVHGDFEKAICQESFVTMRDISKDEITAYWRSKEPRDKAGAYAVQGVGAVFIKRIEGSYSGVMGLPLFETAELLREFGIPVLE